MGQLSTAEVPSATLRMTILSGGLNTTGSICRKHEKIEKITASQDDDFVVFDEKHPRQVRVGLRPGLRSAVPPGLGLVMVVLTHGLKPPLYEVLSGTAFSLLCRFVIRRSGHTSHENAPDKIGQTKGTRHGCGYKIGFAPTTAEL